jgi:hypothetical protein
LRFNAITPSLDLSQLLVIRDNLGNNIFENLTPQNTYDFGLTAGDTGLIILQPNILTLDPNTTNLEFRGYVEIFVLQRFPFPGPPTSTRLLLTPEHRGTFLPGPAGGNDFDQLFTAVPTATGASLMEVDTLFDPPILTNPPIPLPGTIPGIPVPPLPPEPFSSDLQGIQQALAVMTQQIDDLSQQISNSRSTVPQNGSSMRAPV